MTKQHGFSLLFHYKQHCLLCLIPKNRAQERVNVVTNTYHLHQRFIHLDDSVFLLSMLHTITHTPLLTLFITNCSFRVLPFSDIPDQIYNLHLYLLLHS